MQDLSKNHPGYTCQTTLIKRGWTKQMLEKVFGTNVVITTNPHNPQGPPQRLYDTEVACLYERTDFFKNHSPIYAEWRKEQEAKKAAMSTSPR